METARNKQDTRTPPVEDSGGGVPSITDDVMMEALPPIEAALVLQPTVADEPVCKCKLTKGQCCMAQASKGEQRQLQLQHTAQ